MRRVERHSLYVWALISAILFSVLSNILVFLPSICAPFDELVAHSVIPLEKGISLEIFTTITFFGSVWGVIIVACMVAFIMIKEKEIVFRLFSALLMSAFCSYYLKEIFSRPRPNIAAFLQETSFSFPSGHATSAAVLYGFIAIVLFHLAKTRIQKTGALFIPVAFIALVGISRLVLDVHFATDILGGYFLGAFWLCLSLALPLKPVERRLFRTS